MFMLLTKRKEMEHSQNNFKKIFNSFTSSHFTSLHFSSFYLFYSESYLKDDLEKNYDKKKVRFVDRDDQFYQSEG